MVDVVTCSGYMFLKGGRGEFATKNGGKLEFTQTKN